MASPSDYCDSYESLLRGDNFLFLKYYIPDYHYDYDYSCLIGFDIQCVNPLREIALKDFLFIDPDASAPGYLLVNRGKFHGSP